MRDRQRETHRDGGINRVTAGFEHLEPGFGGVPLARDHHAVTRPHGLRGRNGKHPRDQEEEQEAAAHTS